ncbi:MAG: Flp family type IVb pilin [Alsobacter sp.]
MDKGRTGDAMKQQSGLRVIPGLMRLFGANASGQSGIEYAIVAALIGVAVTSGSNTLMPALRTTFAAISTPRAEVASGVGATVPTQVQVTR